MTTSGTRFRSQSLIPADVEDDSPTLPSTSATQLWKEAAEHMSRRLVEAARLKRRCGDLMDPEGSERALVFARETLQISRVLTNLAGISPELSSIVRRACVDRLTGMHVEVDRLLDLQAPRMRADGWVV